jgi:hypothetical protein
MNAFTCVCGQSSITEYFCRVSDLFLCLCVSFWGMIERARTREGFKKCFFFLPIWISLYPPFPPIFHVVRWFVRVIVCVCVCVDLNRRCIHIKQETTGFFLSHSLSLSIRFWIVFVEKRHFCFQGESIWQQIIGSSKYSWILKLGRLRAYYVI